MLCVLCNESFMQPGGLTHLRSAELPLRYFAILGEDLLNIYCPEVSMFAIILSLFRIQFFEITHEVHYLVSTHDR